MHRTSRLVGRFLEPDGVDQRVELALGDESTAGQFDLIACNGVLEYVDGAELAAVQRELDRVLAPGGMILLTGTSNRLWPREAHSGRWLVNYLPRALERLWRKPVQRGVWPWTARHGFGPHYDNLDTAGANNFFTRSRIGLGGSPALQRLLLWSAARLRVGPGMLAQHMSCLLQKHGARADVNPGSNGNAAKLSFRRSD